MAQALQTMHYLGNVVSLQELPLLDGEFDIDGEITLGSGPLTGEWSMFINHSTVGKGVKYE